MNESINQNCVVCQKRLSHFRYTLCSDCEKEYGKDRSKWPKWLKFLVNDEERIRKSEYRQSRNTVRFFELYENAKEDMLILDVAQLP